MLGRNIQKADFQKVGSKVQCAIRTLVPDDVCRSSAAQRPVASRFRAILGHACAFVTLLVHGPQVGDSLQMASDTVSAVATHPSALRTVMVHLFSHPVGKAAIGSGGMAGIAVQPASNRCWNVVADLAVGAEGALRRVSAVVARIAAGRCDSRMRRRVVHDGPRKSLGPSIGMAVAAVARGSTRGKRDMPR